MSLRHLLLALALGLSVAAARAADPYEPLAVGPGEFSVMSYNLFRFSWEDRDDDGQINDFKPDQQIEAMMRLLARHRPDVLAIQEIGDASSFDTLCERVAGAGLTYPFKAYLMMPASTVGLAVLSRLPITHTNAITNEFYTIEKTRMPVQRGFLAVDVQVNPDYAFRLIVAHLKSKRFNPMGQTEMRRNEARLLNKVVRRMLNRQSKLNLLVAGDLNDGALSAVYREIIGDPPLLHDVKPVDTLGDIWTHYWALQESYSRIDYFMASSGMKAELVSGKARAIRDPDAALASDHRPIMAVFKASEQEAAPPADSSVRP